ncbi:hypothetical protein ACMD2_23385 [Ananas comosus]|uniref:Uncharacterized protein n=1 Tax=Ananas comosus TaxID=4615 RepID=A0A199VLX0_ANACO|nr:hypothetical protein ACMD2_23385 [Ananas comosus]
MLRPTAHTAGAVRPPANSRRSLPPISYSSSPSLLLSSPPPPSSISSASVPALRPIRELRDCSGESASEEGGGEFERSPAYFLLGPVPSEAEAEAAVAALNRIYNSVGLANDGLPSTLNKNVADQASISATMPVSSETMGRSSPADQVSNKIELPRQLPANHPLRFNGLNIVQSQGLDRIRNSFRLMQVNPSVQRMVVSLSTDKAVWDAVMKNEAVQQLKQHFLAAGGNEVRIFDEDADIITNILKWILENTKAKIWELIDKIIHLVNELFFSRENAGKQEGWDILSDVVGSAFMLTVMVFLVVIVTRFDGA